MGVERLDTREIAKIPVLLGEKDILKMMREGIHLKLIASKTDTTYETVRTHIKHIYDKLHVSSQAEALSTAFRERLV